MPEKKKNGWIGRKADQISLSIAKRGLIITGAAAEKMQEYAQKALPKTTVKQDCQMVLQLIKVRGGAVMREAVMNGFPTDWAAQIGNGATVAEILQPYRDEPLFEKVMGKLQITWPQLEELARESGARDEKGVTA